MFAYGMSLPKSAVVMFLLGVAGCHSPKFASLESQNRILTEQSRAQLSEIANLKDHTRKLEDQLIGTERELVDLSRELRAERQRMVSADRNEPR
jgi:predicted  nucleic acid-binding Zn-ribbon protein